MWIQSLGQKDPLEKGMSTHSSIFAWRIPWTEKPGWLQSMESQRVRHHQVSIIFTFTFFKEKVKQLVTQLCPVLFNPMDCSPSGFSVHGILQAKILEWVAIPFFKGLSQPRDQTQISCIIDRYFTI